MENFSGSSKMLINVRQITFIPSINLIWVRDIRYNAGRLI